MTDQQLQTGSAPRDFAEGEERDLPGAPRDFAEGEERDLPGAPRDFAEGEEGDLPGAPRDFAEGQEDPSSQHGLSAQRAISPSRRTRGPARSARARRGWSAELLLDVCAVRLDRAHREEELLRDLGVRVAQRDQPQDLDLALGEVVRRPGRLGRRGGQDGAEPGFR